LYSNSIWAVLPAARSFLKANNNRKASTSCTTDPAKDIHLTCCLLRDNNAATAVTSGIIMSNKRFIRFISGYK
jgi:hypothetical protein